MVSDKKSILVVDDEYGVRESFNLVLSDDYEVFLAESGKEAIEIFTKNTIDLILLDIMLPQVSGLDLLKHFKDLDPDVEIIMVSAVKDVETAVKAMKYGAYDYVVKPFIVDDIKNIIARAIEKHHLIREVTYLRDELERYYPFEQIVGKDRKMMEIFDLISTLSNSDGAILIQGESGTGKELIARAIHKLDSRHNHPFVVINCAAIPATLMESEIFGHNKGAFTGASSNKIGKLEIADKGIVFLDDVDLLDIGMQAKLLRVIQEKEFERLGSTKVIKIDVRFIAATNKKLKHLIENEEFREDLYYRLNVFPIEIPPLRERRGDIPILLDHFLNKCAKNSGRSPKRFSKSALKILTDHYDWPGNVRELQNLVESSISAFNVTKKEIKDMPLKEAVDVFEKQLIAEALERSGGSRKEAARILGIHRNTLQKKFG